MTTILAASVTESSSLEWRLPALTIGVGDLDLDLVRDLLGDLDMSLGGGVGGLWGRESPLFGTKARRSMGSQCVVHNMLPHGGCPGEQDVSSSSIGTAGGRQMMCLNLDWDGAGVGGGWSGGGGGGEEVDEDALPFMQSHSGAIWQHWSQFPMLLQHPPFSGGPSFGGILDNIF